MYKKILNGIEFGHASIHARSWNAKLTMHMPHHISQIAKRPNQRVTPGVTPRPRDQWGTPSPGQLPPAEAPLVVISLHAPAGLNGGE